MFRKSKNILVVKNHTWLLSFGFSLEINNTIEDYIISNMNDIISPQLRTRRHLPLVHQLSSLRYHGVRVQTADSQHFIIISITAFIEMPENVLET